MKRLRLSGRAKGTEQMGSGSGGRLADKHAIKKERGFGLFLF